MFPFFQILDFKYFMMQLKLLHAKSNAGLVRSAKSIAQLQSYAMTTENETTKTMPTRCSQFSIKSYFWSASNVLLE